MHSPYKGIRPHRRTMHLNETKAIRHNKYMSLILDDLFTEINSDEEFPCGHNSLWNKQSPVNKLMQLVGDA
jgi:hypothetical protein